VEEKGDQMLSLRISEELFMGLKKYSQLHNENISDSVRKAIEKLVNSDDEPVHQPSSDILKEILEIKNSLKEINFREKGYRDYLEAVGCRINDLQLGVNNVSLVACPFMPLPFSEAFPLPPGAAGEGLADFGSSYSDLSFVEVSK